MDRPTPRYIKHGWLNKGEFNPNIHSYSKITMDERNIKNTNPDSTYYTPQEMEIMRREIKVAECPICFEKINDESCRVCENGHKFHNICPSLQNNEVTKCPSCRSEVITSCNNINKYNDIASGRKKTRKRIKSYKKRKVIKSYKKRKTNKQLKKSKRKNKL
jgi:hypothetical protein